MIQYGREIGREGAKQRTTGFNRENLQDAFLCPSCWKGQVLQENIQHQQMTLRQPPLH